MKKYISIIVAAVMALSIAACGSSASSASQAASSEAQSVAVSSVAQSTQQASSEVSASADNTTVIEGCEGIAGTTQNSAMNGFEIVADDGNTYYFTTIDSTVYNLSGGMADGLKVSVYFGGDELGAANCKALQINEVAEGETPPKADFIITKAAKDDPDNAANIIDAEGNVFCYTTNDLEILSGTVSDAAMNSFTFTADDGTSYSLLRCDGTTIDAALGDGTKVTISYVGSLDEDYALISVS